MKKLFLLSLVLTTLSAHAGITISPPASGGSGGGGGSEIEVLGSDPGSPTEGQSWILSVTENLTVYNNPDVGSIGWLSINVATPTPSEIQLLVDAMEASTIPWGMLEVQTLNQGPGAIAVSGDGGGRVDVAINSGVTTVQETVDAMNVYSQALIGKNMASVLGGNGAQIMFLGTGPVTDDYVAPSQLFKIFANGNKNSIPMNVE